MSRRRAFVVAGAVFLLSAILAAALWTRRRSRRAVAPTPSASAVAAVPQQVVLSAYDGRLLGGWEDWSRGRHETPSLGAAKIMFGDYGTLVLHHSELRARFGGVTFRFRAPEKWGDFLTLALRRAGPGAETFPVVAIEPRHVSPAEDGWRTVWVGWQELNPANLPFDRIVIAARTSVPDEWVLIDKVAFTAAANDAAGGAHSAQKRVTLSVSCRRLGPRINPLIYGAADADATSGYFAKRMGGNPLTRLNWDNNCWNSGNDWFFENGKWDSPLASVLDATAAERLPVALVVPMIGWVAKDATSVGFPASIFPRQRKFDPHRPEAGDGYNPDGSKITPRSPEQTSVPAPPELIGRWITALRQRDQKRAGRSVYMYILDNEPSLWDTTHRDVHPEPVSYDELMDRTLRYASEIRRADPDGKIAGPAEWGWLGYFFSGKDRAVGTVQRPDRNAHGGVALVPYYLQKLAQNEKKSGTSLLDVLDLHYYPAGEGMFGTDARTDPDSAARRVRSVRSIWDPAYEDESWIKEPIRLIPRMKEWVAANYPGRATSIGEWNFGAERHISGALATAEALGRFGEQGLDSAFFWGDLSRQSKAYWAFRAFRNFDGAGSHFLEQSLGTRTVEGVSLFASRDDSRTRIVAVLINSEQNLQIDARVDFEGCDTIQSFRSFVYGPESPELRAAPVGPSDSRSLETRLEPFSLQVLDVQLNATR